MAPNSKPAGAVARPAGPEYFAYTDAAVVLIPRQVGKSYDVIALQNNPASASDRRWVARFNSYPPFSIAHRQLLSATSFRHVAIYQLSRRGCHVDHFLCDLLALPEDSWRGIMERLVANLLASGGGE